MTNLVHHGKVMIEKKTIEENNIDENRSDEPRGAHVDQNQGMAVITGFHSETSEPEDIQLLKESITEIGVTIENARIECSAKPITHAFIHFQFECQSTIMSAGEWLLDLCATTQVLTLFFTRWLLA